MPVNLSSAICRAVRCPEISGTETEFIKSGQCCQGEFSFPDTFFHAAAKALSRLENYPGKAALAGLQNQLAERFDFQVGVDQLLPVELDPPLLDQASGLAV